jgi:NADP-dependent 3-hydroxy acid dehydrogenase YdfG
MEALKGRVGVVTGASSGIGAAVARVCAEAGMAVVLGARREAALTAVRDDIRASGGIADAVVTDLREEHQVEALIAAAMALHGRIDALVNNAAVGTLGTVAEGQTADWRAVLETNVLGTAVACRAALRHMLPRGQGDILTMTSASGREGWPYMALYSASKAALHTFARALRAEVAEAGIRVMTIEIHNVGGTDFANHLDPAMFPAAITRWRELGLLNPNAAMITPDDVARAVVFQLAQKDPASVHEVVIRSRAN